MKSARNYPLLLAGQFLGAFGDNYFLWLIIGPLTLQQQQGEISEAALGIKNIFFTCMLYLPYVLLAPVAGFLSDRYAKTQWLVGGNLIKLAGALVALLSFGGRPEWRGAGYLIIGVGACLFSPAKYGVLPEILPPERLVKANGTVEMLTIAAVLTGSLAGAKMVDHYALPWCFAAVLGIYLLALLCCSLIERTPADPTVRLDGSMKEFLAQMKTLLASPRLSRVLIGCCLFWATGAILKMNFQPWGLKTLQLHNNLQVALLGLWLAAGVMAGSVLAGQMHRVGDLGGVRRYGWLMGIFIAGFGLITAGTPYGIVVAMLVLVGIAGGLFLIPLNAALQAECPPGKVGKAVAVQNCLDNAAMLLNGGLAFGIASRGGTAPLLFFLQAALVVGVAGWLKMPKKENVPAVT